MTAFTGGIKRPQTKAQNSNGNYQQSQYDRLVTIIGYNTQAKTMAAEDDKGKKYEIFVNKDEYLRGEKAAAAMGIDRNTTWMGHSIDKQMEKNYPVGSKVIIQRSRIQKKDNGQGMAVTEVQRIIGVPNPEPDKTFQGIFTLTSRTDENRLQRISRVQHWNNRGVDVNDDDGLQKLKEEMDTLAEQGKEKIGNFNVTIPTMGVQFRALMKTDKKYEVDNSDIYEVVDTSIPFDWMPGPEDESGKEIKSQAHPITGDEMISFVEQYVEHISNHEKFRDHIENMIVEVCSYKSFPASNNKQLQLTFGEPKRDEHADKNPLYQLSHRKSYVDMDQTQDGLIQGRNYAVNGIIQISPNKLEKVNGKPVEINSYWVNNLHANGTKGHVHAFIRTSNGNKAEPHANLKLLVEAKKDNEATHNQSTQQPREATRTVPTEPARQTPTPQVDLDDDFDPFSTVDEEDAHKSTRFGKK